MEIIKQIPFCIGCFLVSTCAAALENKIEVETTEITHTNFRNTSFNDECSTKIYADIGKHIRRIISGTLGIDEAAIVSESRLVEDLGADSLDLVEMIMYVENIFELQIIDIDAEKIFTVQDAINYIELKLCNLR